MAGRADGGGALMCRGEGAAAAGARAAVEQTGMVSVRHARRILEHLAASGFGGEGASDTKYVKECGDFFNLAVLSHRDK